MSFNTPVIDMHCHPSLKTWILNTDFHEDHPTFSKEFLPTDMRVDFPKMKKANVDVIMNSFYLPEHEFFTDMKRIKLLSKVLFSVFDKLKRKAEVRTDENAAFRQTLKMINQFEKKIKEAADKGQNITVAKSKLELEKALKANKKVVLHTIEGAHSLGRKTNNKTPDYLGNINKFYKRGVCMITLAHFYDNDAVSPVLGIPLERVKKLG